MFRSRRTGNRLRMPGSFLGVWLTLALVVAASAWVPAQLRLRPVTDETGDVALQLLFRKLRTTGTFMMSTAHPDDENNGLLSLMSHGLGLRTVLVTATRGDGGQNEIGPEIFDGLAVLRTEELLAAHRFDGPEQYFTRAVDFGYSFSIDETYDKWGKDEIIGDYVRHIRAIRPDVIAGFLWEGTNGGLHHQASTHITAEAFRAAADPARYPEQLRDGLRPWQAAKFYYTGGGGGGGRGAPAELVTPVASGVYDPVLGRTYDEIGSEARTMHRCQDTSQLVAIPGGRGGPGGGRGYHLQDCVIPGQLEKRETSVLDGLDLSLASLVRFAGPTPPAALRTSLQTIAAAVDTAEAAFKAGGSNAAVPGLAAGLHELRALRSRLAALGVGADGQYEIDFRLAQKERQFEDTLIAASSLRIEATGNDMMVTPGQSVGVSLVVANRGAASVGLTRMTAGGTSTAACAAQDLAAGAARACAESLVIPKDARLSDIPFTHDPKFARYVLDPAVPFGVPFAPSPYRATIGLTIGGEPVTRTLTVEARDGSDMVSGEKRSELLVVPSLSLTVSPDVVVFPTGSAARREIRVTVRNNSAVPATAAVHLTAPAGWTVTPASQPVAMRRADEDITVRFTVATPAGLRAGVATIAAEATEGAETFRRGYQIVEYPHIRRRLIFHAAEASVKMVDVKVSPNVTVGYIMGAGDKVPQAIEQLAVPVSMIGPDELAWGNLSKYPVIMTGVRAYNNRPDLQANNQRLMDYVRNGGVMLVNYNRTEFNEAQYGPFPVQTTTSRITDENAPLRVLVPTHPIFTTPNRIGPATWADWVQERGTYFLGPHGPEFQELLESEDGFPNNAGVKRGILVDAAVGKGHWVYIGLVLWRELPAGVPGAYQLLANLLSLGSHPLGAAVPARGASPALPARGSSPAAPPPAGAGRGRG